MNRDVALIAAREIRTRVRSRFFQVSTGIMVLLIAGAFILPTLTRNPLGSVVRIGVTDRKVGEVEAMVGRVRPILGSRIVVRAFDTRDAAEDALRDERIHLAVVGSTEILTLRPIGLAPGGKGRVAQVLSVFPAMTGNPVPVNSLEPPEPSRPAVPIAFMGTAFVYMLVSIYGTQILNGVAEEKGSRVIELLLAAVRPSSLYVGKVVGIGTVALLQAGIAGAAALAAGAATGGTVLTSQPVVAIASMLGWLLLAYTFYAFTYAAAGSMVSRAEDASGIAFPIALPLLVTYIAASGAIGGDDSRVLRVLSFLPPTAPVAMPMRVAIGVASPLQALVAAALTVAGTILVARLGATIYERSILRMGSRVKLRQVLRAPAA